MALRVTQNQMYTSSVFNMNKNLSDLMESNLQASSQLKINRPSDDPLGAGRVVSYKASLENLSLYQDNISSAMGWLGTADSILSAEGSFMTVLTRMKELAEQAATETYDKMNREEISYELRQQFLQLINLANTRWEDRSIFAGQKTDVSAYDLALGYLVAGSHGEPAQVGVAGDEPFAVVYLYDVAVAAPIYGADHGASLAGQHRVSGLGLVVQAKMQHAVPLPVV